MTGSDIELGAAYIQPVQEVVCTSQRPNSPSKASNQKPVPSQALQVEVINVD